VKRGRRRKGGRERRGGGRRREGGREEEEEIGNKDLSISPTSAVTKQPMVLLSPSSDRKTAGWYLSRGSSQGRKVGRAVSPGRGGNNPKSG
jgi:hypothetical protein